MADQVSEALLAEARAFDDEALAALASVGLLRRAKKLLDGAPPGTVEVVDLSDAGDGSTVAVTVGDQRVTFVAGTGLARADCTCATVGPCQHVLAAIVTMRDIPASEDRRFAATQTVDSAAEELLPWLLNVSDDELKRFAGTPALRWALARVDDAAEADVGDGATCVVRPVSGIEVRFMGPSLDSAFCSPAGPYDRRHITLAVLAARTQHGIGLPVLESKPARGATGQVGGVDKRLAERVVRAVSDAVGDSVGTGIAHPSPAMVERFESLSVDARGVGLYRVGGLAARLANHYDDAISLQAGADATNLLADLALTHVVATLSLDALAEGELPLWLKGVARADYSPVDTFEALGLGARPWVAKSGYAGTTGVLYDVTHRRFVEVSSSRRSSSVDVASQYTDPIGWATGTNLAALSGNRVQIGNALLSPQLRLSSSTKTSATVIDQWHPADLAACEWDGAVPRRASRLRGDRASHWAVMAVTEQGRASYDEVRQTLVWPIRSLDQAVAVELGWAAEQQVAVDALERLTQLSISHVIGTLGRTSDTTIVLTPMSVVVDQQLHVLAYDTSSTTPSRARSPRSIPVAAVAGSASMAAVERLGAGLVQLAERGVDSDHNEIDRLARLAGDIGCLSVAHVLTTPTLDPRQQVLRAAHLIEEHRHLV